MNPIQHSLYSHLPPSEGDHHHRVYLHPFFPTYEAAPSFPCATFLGPSQEGSTSESDHHHGHHQQQEVKEYFIFSGGSSDHGGQPRSASTMAEDGEGTQENSAVDGDPPNGTGSGKWLSSRTGFMRKMMMSSNRTTPSKPRKTTLGLHDKQVKIGDSNNGNKSPSHGTTTIRVCSDCNTTKTPLWRSGPHGPKSLCNACGIRQRKARRAMAAAAALAGGLIPPVAPLAKGRTEKRPEGGCTVPFKKRFKLTTAGQTRRQKLRLDEFAIDLSKSSAFHRVFPQDEEEAAILLMGLSCGLIHS